jgi:hypothetical protein
MRICKINEDGSIVNQSIGSVRRNNRGVSFPDEPAESTLNKFGYHVVVETEKPECDASTQRIEAELVLDSGVVTEIWNVVDLPPAALASKAIGNAIKRRRQHERAGARWTDKNGKTYLIATDDNSQQKLTGQLTLMNYGIASGIQHWKIDALIEKTYEEDGEVYTYEDRVPEFRPTTGDEFKSMAAAVKTHIQKCFASEAIVSNMASLGVYTDFDTEFAKL